MPPPVSNSSLCTLPRLHELSCGGTGYQGTWFYVENSVPNATRQDASRERGFVTLRTTACFCGFGTAPDQQGWLWLDQSCEGLPPAAGRSESYGGHAVRPAPRATHGRLPPQHYPFQRVLDGFRSWRGARACVDQPLNYTPDDACPRSAAPCFTLGPSCFVANSPAV